MMQFMGPSADMRKTKIENIHSFLQSLYSNCNKTFFFALDCGSFESYNVSHFGTMECFNE